MELTLANLEAEGACEPGIEWITPIIDSPGVWDRLAIEHPEWLQWAHFNGFDVSVSDKVIDQMGITYVDDRLFFVQTAGYRSTQTAGECSAQTAGDRSAQTAGSFSTQTAGDYSTQKAGSFSAQTAGYRSTQTAGDRSAQTAGDYSTQTAGDYSTQKAGSFSTQTAGECSRHKATEAPCVFVCRYWDGGPQMAVAVVDGVTIKANVFYTYDIQAQAWVQSENQEVVE